MQSLGTDFYSYTCDLVKYDIKRFQPDAKNDSILSAQRETHPHPLRFLAYEFNQYTLTIRQRADSLKDVRCRMQDLTKRLHSGLELSILIPLQGQVEADVRETYEFSLERSNTDEYAFRWWKENHIIAAKARKLILQKTNIQDSDIPDLILLLQNSAISCVDIRNTKITKAGVYQLWKECQKLIQTIEIQYENIEIIVPDFLVQKQIRELQEKINIQAKQLVDLQTQQQRNLKLLAHPESLHRVVQAGDLVTLRLLLGISPTASPTPTAAPAAIPAISATPPLIKDGKDHKHVSVSVIPVEPSLEKQEKAVKDNKPVSDSKNSATEDQKYPVSVPASTPSATQSPMATLSNPPATAGTVSALPVALPVVTIQRDLRGMSFIPIANAFRDHQAALEKQGALFTVEALEQAVQIYLRQLSTPDNQCYLRQLYADIDLLLQAWQHNQLANKEACDVLDKRAGDQLMAEQKSLPETLLEPVTAYIKEQTRLTLQAWQNVQCDEKSHPGLHQRLVRGLTTVACQAVPEEKHPLAAGIQQQQKILLQERFCAKQLPEKALNTYRQLLCGLLLHTIISDNPTQVSLPPAEKEILEHALASEFECCKQKANKRIVTNTLPFYQEAANNLLNQWQAGKLGASVAVAFCKLSMHLAIIDIVPPNENAVRAELLQAAVERLLQQFHTRKLKQFHTRKLAKETADALVQEVTRLLTSTVTPEQQRGGFVWLLAEWKAGRLSGENQKTLNDLLTKQWRELQQEMRQQFDPMLRLATLESMVQRLMQQSASSLHDAKSQPPPAVTAAAGHTSLAQRIVKNSGIGFTAPTSLSSSTISQQEGVQQQNEGAPTPLVVSGEGQPGATPAVQPH